MSYAGCDILFKTPQSHAVRVMKSPGLKPIEARNARTSSACVPYLASMRQEPSFPSAAAPQVHGTSSR